MSDDVIARAREVIAAAAPGPWELRTHDGLGAIACANGWACEDDNPNPEIPDKHLTVLAVNALPALLDVLEAAMVYEGGEDRLDAAIATALEKLREELGDDG